MSFHLIGDIGGTNCRLKLIEIIKDNKPLLKQSENFISNNFPSFS